MRGTIHLGPPQDNPVSCGKIRFCANRDRRKQVGRLAQLGERCVRNAEVRSSILLPSTNLRS
jgi:hypothetical protein